MRASPATDFVTALDAPLDLVRRDFSKWAPTVAVFTYALVILNIPGQFAARWMMEEIQSGDPMVLATYYPVIMGGACCSYPLIFVGFAAQAVCLAHVVAGRPAGLMDSLRPVFRLDFMMAYVVSLVVAILAFGTCCFGGFLIWVPLGLVLPTAIEEGTGFGAVSRSMDLSLLRTGPGLFDRPGWKLVALTFAWAVLQGAAGAVAQLPVLVTMGWEAWDALSSGDPEKLALLGSVNPWVSTLGSLLSGTVQLFTNAYFLGGSMLIYRDARELADGRGLEAAIEGS